MNYCFRPLGGEGERALSYKPIRDVPFFSAHIPEQGVQKILNRSWILVQEQ